MTNKVIFWIVIALIVVVLGVLIYLKEATWGGTLMTVLTGVLGLVIGWVLRIGYVKYIKKS